MAAGVFVPAVEVEWAVLQPGRLRPVAGERSGRGVGEALGEVAPVVAGSTLPRGDEEAQASKMGVQESASQEEAVPPLAWGQGGRGRSLGWVKWAAAAARA